MENNKALRLRQYCWTTIRGARREKVLYWIYVYEGYFNETNNIITK